ncbi:MAG TPA: hypothetical protein VK699_08405 [Terriglobales bacterium]|jgi:hypothetical protein|nr:hypothetical protein [Terriglobales bacterium]
MAAEVDVVVDISRLEDVPVWGHMLAAPKFIGFIPSDDCSKPKPDAQGNQLPPKVLPLTGTPLANRLSSSKDKLLLSNLMNSPACSAYFNSDPARAQYYPNSQLQVAVGRQVQYDGADSVISMYDAGMWEDALGATRAKALLSDEYISCHMRNPSNMMLSDINRVIVAESQVQLPATDSYYNRYGKNYIDPSTILHEALHNLTRLDDDDLRKLLGIKLGGNDTSDIGAKMETVGCAPKP